MRMRRERTESPASSDCNGRFAFARNGGQRWTIPFCIRIDHVPSGGRRIGALLGNDRAGADEVAGHRCSPLLATLVKYHTRRYEAAMPITILITIVRLFG